MKFTYEVNGRTLAVALVPRDGGYRATVMGQAFDVQVVGVEHGKVRLRIGGQDLTVYWAAGDEGRWLSLKGKVYRLQRPSTSGRESEEGVRGEKTLRAPMPGQIQDVLVAEGDRVKKGETLVLLEAMKMVIRVQAAADAQVESVHVEAGQTVDRGQALVELT
jgi:biotin carboxyl carrier protein